MAKGKSIVVRGLSSLTRFMQNLTGEQAEQPATAGARTRSTRPHVPVTFARKRSFFTPSELAFYERLIEATQGLFLVMSKVRLIDLVEPMGDDDQRFAGFTRSVQKHVDFVLLQPGTYQVAAVIELDGSSHGRVKQLRRDEQKARILESAGIPLLRFSSLEVLTAAMIRQRLLTLQPAGAPLAPAPSAAAASQPAQRPSPPLTGASTNAPTCRKCGRLMVRKSGERGPFWACPGFPKCRNIIPIHE